MNLHDELLTFKFAGWHSYTILHAMIDAGIITKFECQMETCLMPTREFAKAGPRGTSDLLVIDHIVPRRDKGSHKIENLRILHNSCNAGWRRGLTGFPHTEETKALIRDKVKQAHAEGKMAKIYTPERGAKISATLTGRPLTDETRHKISEARTGQPSAFKGKTHTPEMRAALSAARKGQAPSSDTIEKIRKANTGKKRTPEQRARISASRLAQEAAKRAHQETKENGS